MAIAVLPVLIMRVACRDGLGHLLRLIFGPVAFATGLSGVLLAVAMLIPMSVDWLDGSPGWEGFFVSAVGVGIVSSLLALAARGQNSRYSRRFGFLLVNALWLTFCLIGALPFMLAGPEMSLTDALFESVSGFTTTGSTVMTGLDFAPRGILLWRSMTQWFGGIGILVIGLLLLPILRIGGMQIFQLESSAKGDNPAAQFSTFAIDLLVVYVVLTLACIFGYVITGMGLFDAINHGLTTISTGGFSTRDSSFGQFGTGARIVAIVFMFAGAMPFVALVRAAVTRNFRNAYDTQIPVLLGIVTVLSVLLIVSQLSHEPEPLQYLVVDAVFSVVSIITTTGYASVDYLQWGALAVGVVVFTTALGGSTGSTAGGIKTYRLIILFRALKSALKELVYPNGVFAVRYEGRRVADQALRSVALFVVTFLALEMIATLALTACGLDFLTAFTGALTAIANTGPGVGAIIGPAGNFQTLPDPAKWILAVTMLVGRLEIMTVLILISPTFWRN